VQVAQNATFASPIIDANGLPAPELALTSPLAEGVYYWRAQVSDGIGASSWSNRWYFVVGDTVSTYLPVVVSSPPCQDLIANGGFETGDAWTLDGSRPPVYTTDQAFTGERSLLCGIFPPTEDVTASSSAYQAVTVPDNITTATLSFFVRRHSEDTDGDSQQVHVLDEQMQVDRVLMDTLSDDGVWSNATFDLSDYAGRTVTIYFNVSNDGDGARTWMYLDDVSLEVCF